MTVKDLIDKLLAVDPDLAVICACAEVEEVEVGWGLKSGAVWDTYSSDRTPPHAVPVLIIE